MNAEKALEIIHLLADGVDPYTGEAFPEDSPYRQSEVIWALYHASWHLEEEVQGVQPIENTRPFLRNRQKRAPLRRSEPSNAGSPWSDDSERALLKAFRQRKTIRQLAAEFSRSDGAIKARLKRLGVEPDTRRGILPNDKPVNQGKRWEKADISRLVLEFDRGASIDDLVTMLGRTRKSVEVKLYFLGRNPG